MPTVPSLEVLTRVGFAARGIMYVLIGFLALGSARAPDGEDALAWLAGGVGTPILALMALGFLAYAIWRLSEAFIDTEGHGTDAKGLAVRTGGAVSGLIHLTLAFLAASLAFGERSGGSGDGMEEGTATALQLPGGTLLVTIAGAALLAAGAWQISKAWRTDFLHYLDQSAAGRPWVIWLGRAGYAARGLVFLLMGWFLLNAGLDANSAEAAGMGEILSSLSGGLRFAVALGLILFGLFSLVEARYRRINSPEVLARLRNAAHEAGATVRGA